MTPICYRCKKAIVGERAMAIKCPLHPERNLFMVPFDCDDFEQTEDGKFKMPEVK